MVQGPISRYGQLAPQLTAERELCWADLQAGLQPPLRYCDWQPHYIQLDPEIGDQIEAYLHGEENLWVVTSTDAVEPERIAALLQREYICVDTQGQYRLWKK